MMCYMQRERKISRYFMEPQYLPGDSSQKLECGFIAGSPKGSTSFSQSITPAFQGNQPTVLPPTNRAFARVVSSRAKCGLKIKIRYLLCSTSFKFEPMVGVKTVKGFQCFCCHAASDSKPARLPRLAHKKMVLRVYVSFISRL